MDTIIADVRQDVVTRPAECWFPNDQGFEALVSAVYHQAVFECFGRNLELAKEAREWLLSDVAEMFADVAGVNHTLIVYFAKNKRHLKRWQKNLLRRPWRRTEKKQDKEEDGSE